MSALRRGLLLAMVVLCLVACTGGAWVSQQTMISPFVLPGATDVTVTGRQLAAVRISFHAPGQSYEWRGAMYQQLVAQGWKSRDYTFGFTCQFAVTWYSRELNFGPITILESAVVGGDPRDATLINIEMHRELHVQNVFQ